MALYSLNEVLRRYDYIFLDTNALLEIALDKNLTLERKCKKEEIRVHLFDFWKKQFSEHKNIYLTEKVFNELKGDYNYSKSTKKGCGGNHLIVQLRRAKRETLRKKNLFFRVIEFDSIPRIISLGGGNSKEDLLYNSFSEKYEDFMKGLDLIQLTDFDFIIIGGVFSKSRGNTAMITKDSALQRAWMRFRKGENISEQQYGCYLQKGLNLFEPIFLKG
jgi:hypothetical protein